MILFIKFSGGMGLSYQGSVDLSTLPGELEQAVQSELSEPRLSAYSQQEQNPFASDSMVYEISYEHSGNTYRIDESQASEALLELIDRLRPYLELAPQ